MAERIRVKRQTDGVPGTVLPGDSASFIPDTGKVETATKSPFRLMDKVGEALKGAAPSLFGPLATVQRQLPESFVEPASQTAGSMVGVAAGGFPGMVAGGTLGSMAGRAELQRRRRGEGESIPFGKAATEIGISGAAGAVGEVLLPGVGKLAKPITRPIGNFLFKKVGQPFIENIFKLMTGITKENTGRVLQRGPFKLLTRAFRNREAGEKLAGRFLDSAKEATKAINAKWAAVTDPLRANLNNVVDSSKILQGTNQVLRDFNLRAAGGGVRKPFFGKAGKDVFKQVRNISDEITAKAKAGNITLDDAISARQELDDIIFTSGQKGLISPRQKAALKGLRDSFKEAIHDGFPAIAEVDTARHQLGLAFKTIERFSAEDTKSIVKLGKMIDSFEDISPAVRADIVTADAIIARETGESFLDAIRDRAAARAFTDLEIRAVRTMIITTILAALGMERLSKGKSGQGTISLGGAVASIPRGAGAIIKGGAAIQGTLSAPFTPGALGAPIRAGVSEVIRQKFLK